MANTPFELYEEAYQLHYREKNIPEAVKIYEAIVRDFPDANECGYAFIQLQKIKANATTARLLTEKGGRMNALVIPAAVVSCIALLVALSGLIITFRELRNEHDRSTLAMAALARIAEGKDREAEALVDKIKTMNPSDELVRELAAAGKARVAVSEPVPAVVKPAADSAEEVGAAVASGEMKKYPGHQKTGRIRAIRPDQHTEAGQPGTVANPEPPKFEPMGTQMKPGKPHIDRTRAFEDRVVKGYVLDEQGHWVTIEQRRKVEEEVLAYLTAGRVLHDGRWLDFDTVKALRSNPQEIAPPAEEEETREFKI